MTQKSFELLDDVIVVRGPKKGRKGFVHTIGHFMPDGEVDRTAYYIRFENDELLLCPIANLRLVKDFAPEKVVFT